MRTEPRREQSDDCPGRNSNRDKLVKDIATLVVLQHRREQRSRSTPNSIRLNETMDARQD